MRTTVIKAGSGVPPEIRRAWVRLLSCNDTLRSPCFSPDFFEILGSIRSEVEAAVLEKDGEIVCIFPFERRGWGLAGPVGSFLSDYHGIISRPEFVADPCELLRSCGLVGWDFAHVPTSQAAFRMYHRESGRSPTMDLSGGYEAYVNERREAGTEQIRKSGNLARRLEREVGPLRFAAHSTEGDLLETLMRWKTEQFELNRWRDCFSIPWVRQAIQKIHAVQTPEFAGMLSTLHAGDSLVAVHFGMRSSTTWHYWFPAYDPAFAKFSPGMLLLLRMAEAAQGLGIGVIDLGCGEHSYKERLMNGFVPTAGGAMELSCPVTFARRVWAPVSRLPFKARCLLSRTPIGAIARRIRDGRTSGG